MLLDVEAQRSRFSSRDGAVAYVFEHLACTAEAGRFLELPDYLDSLGMVRPFVGNPELWRRVGWDPTMPLPKQLVANLLIGQDLDGNQLVRPRPGGTGWQQPRETIISLPCELSEFLLHEDPNKAYLLLQDIFNAFSIQGEREAVRVRVGRGRVGKGVHDWREAKCLTLGFPHFTNKLGEPQLHLHPCTYAPALDMDGVWRTQDSAALLRSLQGKGLPLDEAAEVCGRRILTDQMIATCRNLGIEIDLGLKFAAQEGRVPHGATVTSPTRTITAGEVSRERRAIVMAAKQVKSILGVPAPTPREIQMLLEHPGSSVQVLPVKKPQDLQDKAEHLGLLDGSGLLLTTDRMRSALESVADRLAVAEVHAAACRRLPGEFRRAAELVQDTRLNLRESLCLEPGPPPVGAYLEWHRDHVAALVSAGRDGPRSSSFSDRPPWLLLDQLKNAGYLEPDPYGERHDYRLTAAGQDRLARSRILHPVLVPGARPGLGSGDGTGAGTLSGPRGFTDTTLDRSTAGTRQRPESRVPVSAAVATGRPFLGHRPAVSAPGEGLDYPLSARGLPGLGSGADSGDCDQWPGSRSVAHHLSQPSPNAHAPGRLQPAPFAPLRPQPGPFRGGISLPAHRDLDFDRPGAPAGAGSHSAGSAACIPFDPRGGLPNETVPGWLQPGVPARQGSAAAVAPVVPGTARPPSPLGVRLIAAGRPRQSTLPGWLQAMLESPVAGHAAREMLRGSGMSSGRIGIAPAWELTPAQKVEQDHFNTPRASQVDLGGAGAPSLRPRLP